MEYKRYRLIFWIRMLFILATTVFMVICFSRTRLGMVPVLLAAFLIIQIVYLLNHIERPQRDVNRFFVIPILCRHFPTVRSINH